MQFHASKIAALLFLASFANASPVEARSNDTTTTPTSLDRHTASEGESLRSISEWCSVINNGITIVNSITATANYLAANVKGMSNKNSCEINSGNVDDIAWQFQATSTGPNCDTTAEEKTISDAVAKALEYMIRDNVNQACVKMTHGGTWIGILQLAGGGRPIWSGACKGRKYDIAL